MEIERINHYLSQLTGSALIENVFINKNGDIDELIIKFQGDTGTLDEGEVELIFKGVEVMNISQGFVTPVTLSVGTEKDIKYLFNVNYISKGCSLFKLTDNVNITWYVYASSYKVNILPVFYG